MSITIKPVSGQEPLFKAPVPAAPILPLIKPVNINPMARGTAAIAVESRQYTVVQPSMVQYLLADIKKSKDSSITVDADVFKSFLGENDFAYLITHCNGLGVAVFFENVTVEDDEIEEPIAQSTTTQAAPASDADSEEASSEIIDNACNKLMADVLANKPRMINLNNYSMKASSLPGNKLDELQDFCNRNSTLLMY